MSDIFVPHTPPAWVPGPYVEPATPSRFKRPVSQPNWRTIVVPSESTLAEIAMRYYRSPTEAMRIFNDNRAGYRMPDGSFGALDTPNTIIQPGTTIWLS